MSFFKITPTGKEGREELFIYHQSGSQSVYEAIGDLVGEKLHPGTEVPQSLEFDGWADDMAAPGDVREMEDYTIECITEEEYREKTGLTDTPRHLFPRTLKIINR